VSRRATIKHPKKKRASPDGKQRVQKPIQARLSKQAHMTGARESTTFLREIEGSLHKLSKSLPRLDSSTACLFLHEGTTLGFL